MACRRIADHTKMKRLQNAEGRPDFNVTFYALNKRGEYGSASIWKGGTFSVNDGRTNTKSDSAYLFSK
jgi:site-specific DNA-adenine methylase